MKKYILVIILLSIGIVSNAQFTKERYSIKNLNINNGYSNFGTCFYGSDKMIFASPTKRNYIINNTWKPNGQPFLDLYVGAIADDGEIKNVKKFSSKINTKFHEADVTFSPDLKTVYFSRSNYFNGKYKKDTLGINRIKMFKAQVGPNDEWTNIESMPFNNDNYSTGQPSLSEDGKTLYFTSDMPGTIGGKDIFKVSVNDDGTYGKPINLGPKVNTSGNEMFPFIDGQDLYYSSDGKSDGRGMLDIYVNRITEDGILPAVNLGDNINSDRDDFAFIIDKDKRSGYFSSNRINGKGDDDIYYFHEDIPLVYECNQDLAITVLSKKTKEVVVDANLVIYKGDSLVVGDALTDANGKYNYKADCSSSYKVEASKKYFITTSKIVTTSKKDKKVNEVELFLPTDEFVVLRDKVMIDVKTIYFDYDKFNIRRDAALELDKVIAIMKKYPKLIVECGSHTDSRGPDRYNIVLSDKRAKSTVDYIVNKGGISPDRISGKGYGETQLVNNCSNGVRCTEEQHQLNRRTEFVIVNPEVIN
ncbi:MAG: OmpA family protein [Lutibacter sp.]